MAEESTEGLREGEARAIVEFFKGKMTPTNDLLLEFCNKHKYTPISVERYEDYLYSYEFDRRMEAILPDVCALISKLKWVPECASDSERSKIVDENAAITEEIAFLLEKHNIQYKEVGDVTTKLSTLIRGMLESANVRVGNMAALQLYTAAEEKFGSPLTIRAMARAQRKGAPFHNGGDEVFPDEAESVPARHEDGCPVMVNAGEGHTFLPPCEKYDPNGGNPSGGVPAVVS